MVGPKFLARFKFAPLHYNDGAPCYFRAACLAVFALCLIAQGLVQSTTESEPEPVVLAQDHALGAAMNQGDLNQGNLMQGATGTLHPSLVASAVGPLGSDAHPSSHLVLAANGATATSLSATGLSSTLSSSAKVTRSELDVSLQPSSSFWSLLGLSSDEDKLKAQLLKNRRAALVELLDSVAYFNSCGIINSSYSSCNYRFSKKIKALYDVAVEAAAEGYLISLTAKGEQAQDPCASFAVNSQGEYFAYDQNGYQNLKCFENTEVSKQVMAISQALEHLSSESAEGSALAARP